MVSFLAKVKFSVSGQKPWTIVRDLSAIEVIFHGTFTPKWKMLYIKLNLHHSALLEIHVGFCNTSVCDDRYHASTFACPLEDGTTLKQAPFCSF